MPFFSRQHRLFRVAEHAPVDAFRLFLGHSSDGQEPRGFLSAHAVGVVEENPAASDADGMDLDHPRGCDRTDWSAYPQIQGDMAIERELSAKGWVYAVPQDPALITIQDIMMDELSAAGADQIDAKTAVKNMTDRIQKAMAE